MIEHAIDVARRVEVPVGWTEDVMPVVALLHDVVEDTNVTIETIAEVFGEFIAHPVDLLTRRKGEKYFDYIDRVSLNTVATVVKIADLQSNMDPRRLGRLPEGEQKGLLKRYEKALGILQPLV